MDIRVQDGALFVNDSKVPFKSYEMTKVVGAGANGVVLLARHAYLNRTVAVKVWLRLRGEDKRDKFRQGIEEARKASDAHDHQINTVRIHEAGEVGKYFYAAMDYYDGFQLKHWLEQRPSLWARMEFAASLYSVQLELHRVGVVHGDLHTGNVLARSDRDDFDWPPTDFRIVDFGTSAFTRKKNSLARDQKVFRATMAKLLHPFPVDRWIDHFLRGRSRKYLNGYLLDEYPLRYDRVLFQIDRIIRLLEEDIWGESTHDIPGLKEGISKRFMYGDLSEDVGEKIGDIRRDYKSIFTPRFVGNNWKWRAKNQYPMGYYDAMYRHGLGRLEPYNWD